MGGSPIAVILPDGRREVKPTKNVQNARDARGRSNDNMRNLKDELISEATLQLRKYEGCVQSIRNVIEWAESLDNDHKFHGFIFMPGVYPQALCMEAGLAQELASELSARYGLVFDKSFDSSQGQHRYAVGLNGFRFYVEGKPPTSCNLRCVTITRQEVKYEIDCEPEPAEVPA